MVALGVLAIAVESTDWYDWMCMNQAARVRMAIGMIALVGVRLLLSFRLTQRLINVAFISFSLLNMCSLACFSSDPGMFLLMAPRVHMFQALVSVIYMRKEVTVVMNLFQALVTGWAFNPEGLGMTAGIVHARLGGFVTQMLVWLFTTFLCIVTETLLTDLLWNEATAKRASRAAERLLSGLCDAVVRLDADLRIIKAAPQLIHLMCPTTPLQPEVLEGGLLTNYLASQSDITAFMSVVSCPDEVLKGLAPAIVVNLHHALGREVPVELFHVRSESEDDEWQHLVGIREVRKEGIAPDESLFQGHRSS